MAGREIDDAKALLYVEKARDIMCRNKDGAIPKGTVRIITTNWPMECFWPSEAFMVSHSKVIERRTMWIDIRGDIRKAAGIPADPPSPSSPVSLLVVAPYF